MERGCSNYSGGGGRPVAERTHAMLYLGGRRRLASRSAAAPSPINTLVAPSRAAYQTILAPNHAPVHKSIKYSHSHFPV